MFLGIAVSKSVKHVCMQSKVGKLAGSKKVRGSNQGRHSIRRQPSSIVRLLSGTRREADHGGAPARVGGDVDSTAFSWADGQVENAFVLELFELSLLLAPFGTTLAFVAFVRLWNELFDRNDGNGFGRRDVLVQSVVFAASAFLEMRCFNRRHVPVDGGVTGALGRSGFVSGRRSAGVLEGSSVCAKVGFSSTKTADCTPELMAFAKGLNPELVPQVLELQVKKHIAVDVVGLEAVNGRSIHITINHPVDDLV